MLRSNVYQKLDKQKLQKEKDLVLNLQSFPVFAEP